MVDYRRHEIVSGMFVVAAVVVFGLLAFKVGNLHLLAPLRGPELMCRAYFTDIKTLDIGAKVTVAGRRVGAVRELALADSPVSETEIENLKLRYPERFGGLRRGMVRQRIAVTFALDDPGLRVAAATASVSLVQDGLLGRHYLAFDPGFWIPEEPAPRVADLFSKGLLDHLAVRESAGWDGLIAATLPVVRRIDDVLERLQKGLLDPEGLAAARRVTTELADAVASVRALVDERAEGSVQRRVVAPLQKLLADADSAVAAVRDRLLGETLPRAENAIGQVPQLSANLQEVVTSARRLLEDSRAPVSSILEDTTAATHNLEQRLARLEGEARRLLASATGTIEDNRAELAETVRRLRRASWQAEMALRKIRSNPAVLLFGDDEPQLEANPTDASSLWRAGRAEPYPQRLEGEGR